MIIIDDDGIMHKVLPMDTLDKIRAEIETLNPFDYGYHRNDMLDMVLSVIDKYRNGVNE